MWEPPTIYQALANQRGPRQPQRPLVRAPLLTTHKNADLRHASRQWQSRKHSLLRNSSVINISVNRLVQHGDRTVEASDFSTVSA
jgi:hypothetical protein